MWNWLITVGDALSQFAGRFIPVRVHGSWRAWTDSANESISGAAHRWGQAGRFRWAEKIIDLLISPIAGGHCRKAWAKDIERAKALLMANNITIIRG